MEKVTERDGMEIYENDIAMALSMFCESNQIENIKTESQSVWNGALRYILTNLEGQRRLWNMQR